MIVVNLQGGIGNQMFQYSFGRYLSRITGQTLFLNIEVYRKGFSNRDYDLDIFRLPDHEVGTLTMLHDRLLGTDQPIVRISERSFQYDAELVGVFESYASDNTGDNKCNILLSGYWQSYKYLQGIGSMLLNDFSFCNDLYGKWRILAEQIDLQQSVMINVRRGDFLEKMDYHGVVDMDYLTSAISIIGKDVADPFFYVFSDDIPWCKANIRGYRNMFFVDESYYDDKYQYYLQLMVRCKHFIISNSSFCWWAAWLAPYDQKKVIAPVKWFTDTSLDARDLIPPDWTKI